METKDPHQGRYTMKTTESAPEAASGSATAQPDHDRALVRAITDALVLAVGKQAAHQALRHARNRHHRNAQRRALLAAAHLAGYSALIGYIWRQRRTSQLAT
jgi:hypothetical protein